MAKQTDHAYMRCMERGIDHEKVMEVLDSGEILYEDDKKKVKIHGRLCVVVSSDEETIITTYREARQNKKRHTQRQQRKRQKMAREFQLKSRVYKRLKQRISEDMPDE